MAIASRRPGLGTLVLLVPLVYPDWQAANYFSSSLVSSSASVDFVSLYISANPFDSLANTVVPAIVLFSIVMGVAVKQRRTSRDGRSYGMCCIG